MRRLLGNYLWCERAKRLNDLRSKCVPDKTIFDLDTLATSPKWRRVFPDMFIKRPTSHHKRFVCRRQTHILKFLFAISCILDPNIVWRSVLFKPDFIEHVTRTLHKTHILIFILGCTPKIDASSWTDETVHLFFSSTGSAGNSGR